MGVGCAGMGVGDPRGGCGDPSGGCGDGVCPGSCGGRGRSGSEGWSEAGPASPGCRLPGETRLELAQRGNWEVQGPPAAFGGGPAGLEGCWAVTWATSTPGLARRGCSSGCGSPFLSLELFPVAAPVPCPFSPLPSAQALGRTPPVPSPAGAAVTFWQAFPTAWIIFASLDFP